MKLVKLYTDGACSYNPGPGGYAAILFYKSKSLEISGFVENTTNNQMELLAVIEGLKALKEPCKVEVYSDSAYVVNAINNGWLKAWQKTGFKSAQNKPVANIDLWQQLIPLLKMHECEFIKVKGHSDDEFNNRCDFLAKQQIKNNLL